MATLTALQHKAIKAVLNMIETGEPVGKYDLLVILDDGAGITFGKTQTTENGGGLYILLNKYIELKGKYANNFGQFIPHLYYRGGPSSRKFQLTNNQTFKNTLVMAARNDIIMRRAQDVFFDENYYNPAPRS